MALPAPVQKLETISPQRDTTELGTVGVSLAVQPRAWPLASAASLLDAYRVHDQRIPDLGDIVRSRTIECHCTPDLFQSKVYTPFTVAQKSVPLPLLQVLSKESKQGLLNIGENGTTWVSNAENTLFWDLESGSVKDFAVKKVSNIVSAAPNHSVFSATVKQILIVSTDSEMFLYAVDQNGEIYSTELSIDISTLGLTKIVTSKSGRIFFFCEYTGTTLFEFRYQAKDSWIRRKTERVCHGEYGGLLGGLLGPSLKKSKDAERVRDAQIDDSAGLLYVLTTKSAVHVYSFDPNGNSVSLIDDLSCQLIFKSLSFPKITQLPINQDASAPNNLQNGGVSGNVTVSSQTQGQPQGQAQGLGQTQMQGNNIQQQANHNLASRFPFRTNTAPGQQFNPLYSTPVPAAAKNLVSISPVSTSESSKICLVGITVTGARVYFRREKFMSSKKIKPDSIQYPALTDDKELAEMKVKPASRAFSGKISHLVTDRKVLSGSIDFARATLQADTRQPISFVELSGWFSIDGNALFVERQDESDYILTETSLYTVKNRPFSERFAYRDVPYALVQVYGTMQVCCGALGTAISATSRSARENAIAAFFRFGGLPMYKDKAATGFLGHVSIRLSALFDGLALLLARLVSPVWDQHILNAKDEPPSLKLLNKIHSELTGLVRFLDQNRSFSEGMSNRGGYSNNDDAAMLSQAEYKGLQAMGRLARSCQEGVAFLRLVLTQHDSKEVLSYFDTAKMQEFRKLKFGEFFTAAKESDISKELINSLVSHVLNKGDSVDSVATVIQDLCPSYCSPGDVLEYKALEYIHYAKKQRDPDMTSLVRSVKLIKKAASYVQIDTLEDIVKDYVQLKFFTGAIEAALAVASEQDPANLAIGYLRQSDTSNVSEPAAKRRQLNFNVTGATDANNTTNADITATANSTVYAIPESKELAVQQPQSETELKFRAKNAIYDLIFKYVLTPHAELADAPLADPIKATMLESQDEVWHFALYNWFLENNRQDQIALLDTPYVVNYLQVGANKDLRIANLLWKWYQRRGDILAAADVLLDLARGPLAVNLSQRVEYLSRAMGYCQAQVQPTPQAVNMTTMVRAYLGLALLQTDIQKIIDDPRLDRQIYSVSELYNDFAEARGLYDLCLAILEFADYRDPVIIKQCWDKLLMKTRAEDAMEGTAHYAHVTSIISQLGTKYNSVESIFSPENLVPMFEDYSVNYMPNSPNGWLVNAFELAGTNLQHLETIYERILANDVLIDQAKAHAQESLIYLREKLNASN